VKGLKEGDNITSVSADRVFTSAVQRVRRSQPSRGDRVKSLKDVPLKQRRKEAREPLYLVRYE
jgi:hypothetical protein